VATEPHLWLRRAARKTVGWVESASSDLRSQAMSIPPVTHGERLPPQTPGLGHGFVAVEGYREFQHATNDYVLPAAAKRISARHNRSRD
jgi:hypothetical protein